METIALSREHPNSPILLKPEISYHPGNNSGCGEEKSKGKEINTMQRYLLILMMLLCMPLSLWAMTPVADDELSLVTGQAGVNINADVTMNIAIGTMAWGDASGIDTGFAQWGWGTADTTAGYVGVTNFNISGLRVAARENPLDNFNGYTTTMLKPITIDVGSGLSHGGATFVRFGLGSLDIRMNSMTMNVALGTAGASLSQVLGTVNIASMIMYINPSSYVDIYTAGGVGVNFFMNVIIDQFSMGRLAWGDTDGAGSNVGAGGVPWFVNSTAGYVGLQLINVGGPISISGSVRIDVGTVNTGVYAAHGPTTVVHMVFGDNFTFNVTGPITANVRLGPNASLQIGAHELGNIYISSLNVAVADGSWVDIWAH